MIKKFELPNNLKGRSLRVKVIPTVCNIQNMLTKLVEVYGDYQQLKQWERRSFKAYQVEEIKEVIINSEESQWIQIIR